MTNHNVRTMVGFNHKMWRQCLSSNNILTIAQFLHENGMQVPTFSTCIVQKLKHGSCDIMQNTSTITVKQVYLPLFFIVDGTQNFLQRGVSW